MLIRNTAPAIHPLKCRKFDFPEPVVLPNGIELWSISGGCADICRVSLFTPGGELSENKPLVGILTALMLYKGHSGSTSFDISEQFDYNGAFHSSNTFRDYTENSFCCLNKNLAPILRLFADCISTPTFPAKELSNLKSRLVSSLKVSKQNTSFLATAEMRKLCYGSKHPLGAQVSVSGIKSITRADLAAFHNEFYAPEGSKLIVSGNVSNDIFDLVTNAFGQLKPRSAGDHANECPCAPFSPSTTMLSVVNCKDSVQSSIKIRIPTIGSADADFCKLQVLVTAFGGYFGSRLNKVIREDRGLTYGIGATLSGCKGDSYVEIQTDSDVAYTSQVIDAVGEEITKLKAELIPAEELECVKQFMTSRLIGQLDSPFKIASHIGRTIVDDSPKESYNSLIDAVAATTAHELRDIAQRHLNFSNARIVVACDKTKLTGYKNHRFHFE